MEKFESLSERGKPVLVVDSVKFTNHKLQKNGEIYWRCTNRSCKAKVYTLGPEKRITRCDLQHNHKKNDKQLNREVIIAIVKPKAVDHICEKTSKIIQSEHQLNSISVKDTHNIPNNIYNNRRTTRTDTRWATLSIDDNKKVQEFVGDLIEHVDVGQIPTQCEDTDSSVDFLPESDEPPAKRSSTSATSVRQMETFCRLCLNQTTKNQMICLGNFHDLNYPSHSVQFKKNKILQTDMYLRLIRLLMPNFDHELVYNPVMCQSCSTKLQMASDFVEQCMASQKLIQQYKDTYCPSQGMVSCEDVVQNKPQIPSPNSSVPDVSQNVKKRKIAKSSPPVLVQQKKQQQPSKSYDIVTDMPKLIIKTEALDEFEPDDKFEVTSNDISNIKEEVEESCMYVATDYGDMSVTTEAVVKNEPSACKIKTPGLNPTDSSLGINVPDSKTGSKIISGECYNNVPVESFVTETFINSDNRTSTTSIVNIYLPVKYQNK